MPNKTQIIEHFKSLDVQTLNQLYQFSKLVKILYPEEDLLVNANMAQMVDKSLELRKTYLPEWDDSSDSDFGTFLTELVALFSEKDFWYINSFFNEGFFGKMRMFRHAYLRSIELGYYPRVREAAEAEFEILFPGASAVGNPPSQHVYEIGALIIEELGTGMTFTNADIFEVPFSTSDITRNVNLINGIPYQEEYVYNGDHIFVDREDLSFKHVSVLIDDVFWDRVPQFGLSTSEDKHFVVFPEVNGSLSIYFGDGEYGLNPEYGANVTVFVFETLGEAANRPTTSFAVTNSDVDRLATQALSSPIPNGGLNQETMSSVVNRAPLESFTRKGIINEFDVQNYLLAQSDVTRAAAFFTGSSVTFFAIGTNGEELSAGRRTQLAAEIEQNSVLLGYVFTGVPVNFVTLPLMRVVITITRSGSLSFTEARTYVLIEDFYNPSTYGDFGRPYEENLLRAHLQQNLPHLVRIDFFQGSSTTPYPNTIPVTRTQIFRKPEIDQVAAPNVTVEAVYV